MGLDFKIIGQRLKKARLEKGITQETLSEELNVSVTFLSRIETGSSQINLKRLNEICSILNIPEGVILNGTNSASKDYLNSEFNDLIKNCPPEKIKLIYEVVRVIVANK